MPASVVYSGEICERDLGAGERARRRCRGGSQHQLQPLDVALEGVGHVLLDLHAQAAAAFLGARADALDEVGHARRAGRNSALAAARCRPRPWRSPRGRRSPPSAVSVEARMRWKCSTSAGSNSICWARIEIAEMPSSATESSAPIFSMSAISEAPRSAPRRPPPEPACDDHRAPAGSSSTSSGWRSSVARRGRRGGRARCSPAASGFRCACARALASTAFDRPTTSTAGKPQQRLRRALEAQQAAEGLVHELHLARARSR